MKKLLLIAAIIAALAIPGSSWAVGSCTQTATKDKDSSVVSITFACTGDAANGSIPDTDVSAANMALVLDKAALNSVVAYPTSGGTAPDAADVQILMNSMDLLGGLGTNLIHATATQGLNPSSTFTGDTWFPIITGTLTLKVSNQATASANYTVKLLFYRR